MDERWRFVACLLDGAAMTRVGWRSQIPLVPSLMKCEVDEPVHSSTERQAQIHNRRQRRPDPARLGTIRGHLRIWCTEPWLVNERALPKVSGGPRPVGDAAEWSKPWACTPSMRQKERCAQGNAMTDQSADGNIWSVAADLLDGKGTETVEAQAGAALLARLDFPTSDIVAPADRRVRIALLRFAARMTDLFELAAPDAPGLFFLGGMTRPSMHRSKPLLDPSVSSGGSGTSFRAAFSSCAGEAVERVSQYQSENEALVRHTLAAGLAGQSAAVADASVEDLRVAPHAPTTKSIGCVAAS